jgi:hypothetical protein
MNTIKKLINSLRHLLAFAACIFALAGPPAANAADYAVQGTFFNFPITSIANGVVSNANATIDVTQFTEFALDVKTVSAVAVSGASPLIIKWRTSLNGTDFNTSTNDAPGHAQGWFAVPMSTGGSLSNYWTTNITVNGIGYWQLQLMTNNTGQTLTNVVIRGYVKPKRTNSDF